MKVALPLYLRCSSVRWGMVWRHGPHQVAQNSKTETPACGGGWGLSGGVRHAEVTGAQARGAATHMHACSCYLVPGGGTAIGSPFTNARPLMGGTIEPTDILAIGIEK
jgi:hypothetical protein